ncbi:MAG: hypothetical protein P4L67_01980, partial [Candidatus Pacebacteria bacterium]|nr:hypothetical protein [Candidatus Paceibacterota bacterium]
FGVIVYGGIRYMTSAGNPSGQGDAKDWIQAAIMGILLLAGAYFILKVINPNLVNLTLPDNLQSVGKTNNTSAGTGNAGGTGGTTTGGTTQTASTCKATSNGGTSGTCPNLSDGTAQNCCYANGGAICQKDACAASVTCGSVDSKGNSQSGSCPSNQSCYSYKGWTGKTTYNCKVKGFL